MPWHLFTLLITLPCFRRMFLLIQTEFNDLKHRKVLLEHPLVEMLTQQLDLGLHSLWRNFKACDHLLCKAGLFALLAWERKCGLE